MKKNWLKNKNVIISGASGGLGFAITKLLVEKFNCNVFGLARNEQKLQNVKALLKDKGGNFDYCVLDVSKRESWNQLKQNLIEKSFYPDVLINNAGFMLKFSKFDNYTESEIDEIVQTNLMACINSVKILMPLLKKSKTPAIINISSAAGLCAVVGQSMYCATKFGVKGFTESLQQDYKKQIYVAGVYPGFIKTDILQRQNVDTKSNKLINKLMMPVEKASKRIVKGISKRKKRIIMGFDGQSMNFFGRIFPRSTPSIIRRVLKASKLELFDEVFKANEVKK